MPEPTPEQIALAKIEARTQAKAAIDTAVQFVVHAIDKDGKQHTITVADAGFTALAAVAMTLRSALLSGMLQQTPEPAPRAATPAVTSPPLGNVSVSAP